MAAFAFLCVDVDGYANPGVSCERIVSRDADGFRARELGWVCRAGERHGAGAVYFFDEGLPPLAPGPTVSFVRRLHGLPVAPGPDGYPGEAPVGADRLLEVLRALHDAAAAATGLPVVVVHKGGPEGAWAARAVPGVATLDLTALRCPRVNELGRRRPELLAGRACMHHATERRRSGMRAVHCPQLELHLMLLWLGGFFGGPALVVRAAPALADRPSAPGAETLRAGMRGAAARRAIAAAAKLKPAEG